VEIYLEEIAIAQLKSQQPRYNIKNAEGAVKFHPSQTDEHDR